MCSTAWFTKRYHYCHLLRHLIAFLGAQLEAERLLEPCLLCRRLRHYSEVWRPRSSLFYTFASGVRGRRLRHDSTVWRPRSSLLCTFATCANNRTPRRYSRECRSPCCDCSRFSQGRSLSNVCWLLSVLVQLHLLGS